MAFVKQELAGGEGGKTALAGKARGEGVQVARAALGAGEGDVGVVRTRFRFEAAGGGFGDDTLLELEELRRGLDAEVKNGGAIEEARLGEPDEEGRRTKTGEARDEALVLRRRGFA